jgi:DNA-binding response OmpR family regulator
MRVLVIAPAAVSRPLARELRKEGIRVDHSSTCKRGDQRARGSGYDAIVLDLEACGGDAVGTLQAWRQDGLPARVLAVTASRSAEERVACLNAGADDCLAHPFLFSELLARLRALMRRSVFPGASVLRIDDLEIDPGARQVRRGGKKIALSPREYDLLEFLARNRGRVVSRALIWEHLYGGRRRGGSNVIDVYVRYLRRKLDDGFDRPLIHTFRGLGYQLGVGAVQRPTGTSD